MTWCCASGDETKAQSEILMKDLVAVKNFIHEHEASVAKDVLAAGGINAVLSKDDCGGARPNLNFAHGIQLFVHFNDQEKARQILGGKFD